MDVDFYTANAHKWLFAPKGSAFLYVSKAQQQLHPAVPNVISARANHTADLQTQWAYDPHLRTLPPSLTHSLTHSLTLLTHSLTLSLTHRYTGTKDYAAYIAMADALDFRERTFGGDAAIKAHLKELADRGADILVARWATDRALAPACQTAALVNVRLPVLPSEVTCDAVTDALLREHDTFVPVFVFQGAMHCRVSAAVYNEEEDYEYLAAAVLAVLRDLRAAGGQ